MAETTQYANSAELGPTQALLFARGIEMVQAEHPGTVQFDSPASGDSYDRVVAMADYYKEHPEVEHVAIVNRCTFMAPAHTRPERSEALAMKAEGVKHGLDSNIVVLGEESRSTAGGAAEVARKRLIDPSKNTLLITQLDHVDRQIEYLGIALPETPLTVMIIENSHRQHRNQTVSRNDKIAELIYAWALRNVETGDIGGIERADQMVQKFFAPFVALRGLIGRAEALRGKLVRVQDN